MTIRPGQEWGRPISDPTPVAVAASDAELASVLGGQVDGPLAVSAGDLHRAVGSPRRGSWSQTVPVDVLTVRIDDQPPRLAVAHIVARGSWWRGPIVAICNVDYIGDWNVAPRAHPNDGRADVLEVAAEMGLRARWQAWRRLAQGTHVPHPSIGTRSVRQMSWEFVRPTRVWLDGVPVGRVRRISVEVDPDAFELLI